MTISAQILKQVEFYFSDSNLPNDKFLLAKTREDPDGWVALEIIASFARMKKITTDNQVIVDSLKESTLLELNEDNTKIKRKTALPEDYDPNPKSLYMKGFSQESEIEDINAIIEKVLTEGESILSTRLRRFKSKDFKGSVFVEFNSEETAKRVAGLSIKVTDDAAEPLLIKAKNVYLEEKKAERAERIAANKKEEGDKEKEGETNNEGEKAKEVEITPNLIVHLTDVSPESSREDIKEAFEKVGANIAFVEYNRGNRAGYVRLDPTSDILAKAAAEKLAEDKIEIGGCVPELIALEGEDEKAYWVKVAAARVAKRKGGKNFKSNFKRQKRN